VKDILYIVYGMFGSRINRVLVYINFLASYDVSSQQIRIKIIVNYAKQMYHYYYVPKKFRLKPFSTCVSILSSESKATACGSYF
jgi:hypothetical protein